MKELIQASQQAVADAIDRSHLAVGYEHLQTRDASGNRTGQTPYTDAAIRAFQKALARDPEDLRAVHHLAIAHHARAWDYEIQGNLRAAAEWAEALGHWRTLAASAEFWAGLQRKLAQCDPEADPAFLITLRRDLLEQLLDIHVDFIRHYCERNEPERAATHVQIINAARVPPALRKRLTARVFEAMTSTIPEAKAQRAYESALATVERFLLLFPNHLAALRLHAELTQARLGGLSYLEHWDEILAASVRSLPFMSRLAGHADIAGDALAQSTLESLAEEFAMRAYDRASPLVNGRDFADLGFSERTELKKSLELSLSWGRLAYRYSPGGSRLRDVFTVCVQNHTFLLHQEAQEVMATDINPRDKLTTALGLYEKAEQAAQEGLQCSPGNDGLTKNLDAVRSLVGTLRSHLQSLSLFGSIGGER